LTNLPKLNVTNPSEWVWDTCTILGKQAAEKKSMFTGYGHTLEIAQMCLEQDKPPLNPHALSPDTPFTSTDFLAALQTIGRPRPSSEDDPDAIIQRVDYCSEVYEFCLSYFGEAGSGVYTKFVTDYDKWWEVKSRELHKE